MRARARLGGASLCVVLACAGGGAAAAPGKVLESQQRYAPTAAQLALVEQYRGAPLEDFSEAVFDAGKTDMPYRLLAPPGRWLASATRWWCSFTAPAASATTTSSP